MDTDCKHRAGTLKKVYSLAGYFDMHWEPYMRSPKVYVEPEQLKAVNALRVCRTAVLGVEQYVCEECGEVSEIYHSCKNRFCPTCSWQDTLKWADKISKNMLRIKHRHVVFTLPHSLHGLLKRNREKLLGLLMRVSAETLKDWFSRKYKIKIGIINVLHTFGEKKNYHPHVHMIVSWGGIGEGNVGLKEIESEYVNYKFLQKKFRIKYEDVLIGMYDSGELESDYKSRQSFMRYVKRINSNNWQLHIEPSMKTPKEVIRYIGRYSKRACISEYKITNIDGAYISYKYKDYKDRDEKGIAKEKIERLHYEEFFPRLLQHVPPAYFRVVRYYGLYSNHGKIPKEYKSEEEEELLGYGEAYEDPLYCKVCKRKKVHFHTYYDIRSRKDRKGDLDEILKRAKKELEKTAA